MRMFSQMTFKNYLLIKKLSNYGNKLKIIKKPNTNRYFRKQRTRWKINCGRMFFNFFNEQGTAFVVIENLDEEYPRYAMTEISSELTDSFNDLLDDEENWKKLGLEIKKYIEYWNELNSEE